MAPWTGRVMYRKSVWFAVCIWATLAGCRSFAPAGRATVLNDREANRDVATSSPVNIWKSCPPDLKIQQTSDSSEDETGEVIPTATNESRTAWGRPDLGSIYSRTSQSDELQRNPIIVIPGILGSRLVDDTERRVVWGEFGGNGIDPSTPEGARLLALPIEDGQPLDELTDTNKVAGTTNKIPMDAPASFKSNKNWKHDENCQVYAGQP